MPELPEVETVVRSLRPHIVGKTIDNIDVVLHDMTPQGGAYFKELIENSKITGINRRGKYIIIDLHDKYGDELKLIGHLRMTGKLIYKQGGAEELADNRKYAFIHIKLNDGWLFFCEVRKFGFMEVVNLDEFADYTSITKLGPEPFSDGFEEFKRRFKAKKKYRGGFFKNSILDQELIAGIGNIYADEILHACGIHPTTYGYMVSDEELPVFWDKTREILQQSIEQGGSSISDYEDGNGNRGNFQNFLKVYGRKDCGTCGNDLQVLQLGGRTARCCLKCQPPRGGASE
jgi:formamidopyrimidine-DNA glycosylase